MEDLTRSNETILNPDRKLDLKKLSEVLGLKLAKVAVTLDPKFFKNPE
jgi:hypothetical protein